LEAEATIVTEINTAKLHGELVEARRRLRRNGVDVLRTVRAGMLAMPSRVAARLPHHSKHDVAEIDAEIRAGLGEIGGSKDDDRP
jgi:phage terminase Nu1 subunit (DNA packaging protein)